MKIFITGSTGFLGSYLVPLLIENGHQIRCWVRKSSNTDQLKKADVEIITGKLSDRTALVDAMQGMDAVIHMANVYSFWEPEPSIYEEVNINGTINVLLSAMDVDIKKFLLISTAVIYGNTNEQPFNENTQPGTERFSHYAESKYYGELFARKFSKERNLPLVVIQPASIIGPEDVKTSGAYVASIIQKKLPAIGFKQSKISFVHVNDVAAGIVSALEKEDNIGETYIIGHNAITLDHYMKKISEYSGVSLPALVLPDWLIMMIAQALTVMSTRSNKPPLWGMSLDQARTFRNGFQCDGSKAERELGIQYTPIDTAIKETVEWWMQKNNFPKT
ncbi:MAG: NAD-dependent epimerase/dehydratase family protein [Anaerolineaceae bacterium]|nr:NAD-dependent epimerase/dehydratase family protein [Anaerolineaceae bacterium]